MACGPSITRHPSDTNPFTSDRTFRGLCGSIIRTLHLHSSTNVGGWNCVLRDHAKGKISYVEDEETPLAEEVTAGVVGMMPILGPVVAPFAKRLHVKIREEWERNSSKALESAEQISGYSREELQDQIAEDPRLLPLLTRVLYAAGTTGQDKVLRALGAALGDAVRNRQNIDEAELLLIAMSDLRSHHIVVLDIIAGEPPSFTPSNDIHRWNVGLIAATSGYEESVANLCIVGLINSGLVRALGTYGGGSVYEITELGNTLLTVLRSLE
jgi:hypothetical protein